MANLLYQKAADRINKKISFNHFSNEEKKWLKMVIELKNVRRDIDLYYKYEEIPRKAGGLGAIDWEKYDKMDKRRSNAFSDLLLKEFKLSEKISKYEDMTGIDTTRVTHVFLQINTYSQSFK